MWDKPGFEYGLGNRVLLLVVIANVSASSGRFRGCISIKARPVSFKLFPMKFLPVCIILHCISFDSDGVVLLHTNKKRKHSLNGFLSRLSNLRVFTARAQTQRPSKDDALQRSTAT
jgi:hypothetical protein